MGKTVLNSSTTPRVTLIRVAVSGIPRGYQFPRPDGNWLQEKHRNQILSISPEVELIELPETVVHEMKRVEDIEVLLGEGGNHTHYPGELDWEDYQKFFGNSSLRWVQLCSTGFSDNITQEILDGSVTMTNSPGVHTVPISESVLAGMLEHAKMFSQRRIDQRERVWRKVYCSDLEGATVLLIGLGNLGKRIARLCKAFDMRVIGTKRSLEPVENVDLVFPVSGLKEHLPEADYVVVVVPLTSETEGLLGEAEFRLMKDTCYFINVGRGRIVDEGALIDALYERRIGGAYLDCFSTEPLPADNPLWGMANVFLVPHDSHSSPKIGDRIVNQFCENLRRYVAGEPLLNICNPLRGY
jgi:D-2-hydroxyacid dehydrogenase (NADP+)